MPSSPLEISEDWSQAQRLNGAIRAYEKASGRGLTFAVIKTGRELTFALHKETVQIAPSPDTIRSVPEKAGWLDRTRRHVRRPDSGEKQEKIRRELVGSQSAGRGIQGLIAARLRHRKFLAAGWLPALRGFLAAGENGLPKASAKKLGALVAQVQEDGNLHLRIINHAGPVRTILQRKGVLRRAVNRVYRGMNAYIKRKLGEEARKAFWQIGKT